MAVQPGLYLTWSETPKTGFLTTRLISGCGAQSHVIPSFLDSLIIEISVDPDQNVPTEHVLHSDVRPPCLKI